MERIIDICNHNFCEITSNLNDSKIPVLITDVIKKEDLYQTKEFSLSLPQFYTKKIIKID